MNKNKLNMTLRCTAVVASILALFSLLLKFAKQTIKSVMGTQSKALSTKKWMDSIKDLKKLPFDIKGVNDMNTAKVFLFITIALLVILVAALVVNFFISKKAITLCTCCVAAVSCVSTLVFLITVLKGLNGINDSFNTLSSVLGYKSTLAPNAGAILFVVFGFIAAASAIACAVQAILSKAE